MEDTTPTFRAAKRRKTTAKLERQQSRTPSDTEDTPVSGVVKAAHLKTRPKGVQFSATRKAPHDDDITDSALTIRANDSSDAPPTNALTSRFIGSGSGTQVVDADKLMTEYIDRAMAERSRSQTQQSTSHTLRTATALRTTEAHNNDDDDDGENEDLSDSSPAPVNHQTPSHPQPQSHHHLTEVPLDPLPPPTKSPPTRPRRGPRPSRTGHPRRPRPRRGPDPETLARARLVEDVLREHGISSYTSTATAADNSSGARPAGDAKGTGTNEDLDEKVASAFQTEFLDALAERLERQSGGKEGAAGSGTGTGSGSGAGTSSGPRLGGSRSARAKMAALQQKEKAEKAGR